MTGAELIAEVKLRFPSIHEDEVHSFLMCCTCFPFGTIDQIRGNLDKYMYRASSPEHAIELAHQEIDLAWEESRKQRECETCRGYGMIGGPSYSQPDEGGVPCPDCQD